MRARDFEATDAERVSEILCAAFRSFLAEHFDASLAAHHFAPPHLVRTAHVKDPFAESRLFVAEDAAGRIAGVVRVTARKNGLGCLDYVAVDPACQARGIGSILMARAESFWAEHKQRKIDTCVSAHNRKALRYYLKHGFIKEGYRRDHFMEGVDEIILGRFLTKK